MLEVTCTCCPLGCAVEVGESQGRFEYVGGASCGRGQKYAVAEASCPERVVTATVFVPSRLEPLSVRTAEPVPKSLVFDVVAQIKALCPNAPVSAGDVVCENVCQTGVSVIATKTVL